MSIRRFNWRLAIALWVLGLPGVIAATALALPQLLPPGPLPAPLPVIMAAAAIQSSVLLGLSAFGGTAAAPKVQLRSPVLEAWLNRTPAPSESPALLIAGAVGGAVGAMLLFSLGLFTPHALLAAQDGTTLPLIVRLLYGGITEEVLIRWGLMSVILWSLWRVLQRGHGKPSATLAAASVVLSAVIFGLGHLPAAAAVAGSLDAGIIVYIVTANALFGLVAGYLFWRYGLESAMVAHLLAHMGAHALAR